MGKNNRKYMIDKAHLKLSFTKTFKIPLYIIIITCLLPLFAACNLHGQLNKKAIKALIKRVVPNHYKKFEVRYIPKAGDKDTWALKSQNDKIILNGNNGVSVASALNYYLKNFCHAQYTPWYEGGTNLNLPDKLPPVPHKIKRTSPYKYRYYLNYVTFDYSMLWWDWKRWQEEIDWMALHGINMPLAFIGRYAVWEKVFSSMGFPKKDLRKYYFTGPAFSAFNWFGLVDGLGGPLPQSWINSHKILGRKIIKREQALGMTPVLPAFMGHVPPNFKKKYPEAQLRETSSWAGFPKTKRLEPNDSLFRAIGSKIIRVETKMYGTSHLYAADPFIEVIPSLNDPKYLAKLSRNIYRSMSVADSEAVWVLESWFLHYKSAFWKSNQTKAFMNPDVNMIVLDLFSETSPQWKKTDGYYGKPWIWCMLNDFGGRGNLHGPMRTVARNPLKTLHNPSSKNMVGIGLSMESIEQNPVMYYLMLANIWRDIPIDLNSWLKKYVRYRYGKENKYAVRAWKTLKNTAYATKTGYRTIIQEQPSLTISYPLRSHYNPTELLPAWKLMLKAANKLEKSDAFQRDLVDITRQVLDNYSEVIYRRYVKSYQNKKMIKYKKYSSKFLELIDDITHVLKTRKEFLLGPWVQSAKSWGTNKKEKRLYVRNAKNLITVWGSPKTNYLMDYSARKWAGLYEDYYKIRWKKFFHYADECRKNNKKINIGLFHKRLKKWEWRWVNDWQESYITNPQGNPVKVAKKMYKKYYNRILNVINSKNQRNSS